MSVDGLSLAASRAAAASAQKAYRLLLGLDLALRALAALAALVAPSFVLGLLAVPDLGPTAWVRAWGGALLLIVAFQVPGWWAPVRARWCNVVGIAGRAGLALLYLLLWDGFVRLAVVEAAFAALLALAYFRLFKREIMTRP